VSKLLFGPLDHSCRIGDTVIAGSGFILLRFRVFDGTEDSKPEACSMYVGMYVKTNLSELANPKQS
jgi:hypothetical protein